MNRDKVRIKRIVSDLHDVLVDSRKGFLFECDIIQALSFKIGLFEVKDPIPDGLRSHVVYKFACAGCNACYVGKTTRHFSTQEQKKVQTQEGGLLQEIEQNYKVLACCICVKEKRMIILIAGVCGCGKTTVGKALAEKMGWPFEDADNFHSASNVSKMKQGIPLTDEDRLPWLMSLHKVIQIWRNNSESGILACSALKSSYREIILHGKSCTDESNQDYMIVFLEGSKQLIQQRMVQRDQHFMPLSLLDSQFKIFESSDSSSCSLNINIEKPVAEIIHQIIERINEIQS